MKARSGPGASEAISSRTLGMGLQEIPHQGRQQQFHRGLGGVDP